MSLEARKRPGLVGLHEPTEADHVDGDDRSEPALWPDLVHSSGSFATQRSLSD